MEIINTFPRLRGATVEGISANLHGCSTKNCKADQPTSSVTVTSAFRFLAMPANTPATAPA
jgi:hypothetical protein